jgi:hypothetical protein
MPGGISLPPAAGKTCADRQQFRTIGRIEDAGSSVRKQDGRERRTVKDPVSIRRSKPGWRTPICNSLRD